MYPRWVHPFFIGRIGMKYIAHIRDDGTEQTVMDHLKGTADRAKK